MAIIIPLRARPRDVMEDAQKINGGNTATASHDHRHSLQLAPSQSHERPPRVPRAVTTTKGMLAIAKLGLSPLIDPRWLQLAAGAGAVVQAPARRRYNSNAPWRRPNTACVLNSDATRCFMLLLLLLLLLVVVVLL